MADIRKFFFKKGDTGKPSGGAAEKPKSQEGSVPATAGAQAPSKPAAPAAAVSRTEAVAKPAAASPAAAKKAAKASPSKAKPVAAVTKRKKAQLVEDDSDVEEVELNNEADADFQVDLTAGTDSDEGWGQDLEAEGKDGSQREGPAAKKLKGAGGRATPAKKAGAAAAGDAAPDGVEGAATKSRGKAATPAQKKSAPASGAGAGASGRKKGAAAVPKALQGLSDEALAAVAAVDEAAKGLPEDEEALGTSFMAEGAFNQRPSDDPPHWHEKEPPRGHPDCLTGKTFVFTGVLDSLKREEAADFVKRHGGKVTTNVSSRTAFLVAGQYSGRSKFAAARAHNVRITNEEGLFTLVRAAPDPQAATDMDLDQQQQPAGQQQPDQKQQQQGQAVKGAKQEPQPAAPLGAPSFYGGARPQQPTSALAALNSMGRAPGAAAPSGGAAAGGAAAAAPAAAGNELWVEKWRPKIFHELVGNNGLVATLQQWLKDWELVQLHGQEPQPPPGSGSGPKREKLVADLKKKAVLLSGPPGIGKTTSALIVCRALGYEPVEVNASDTRGKADAAVVKGVGGKLANAVKELSTNRAVSYDVHGRRKKLCLIMDEVDGMSAGDRGGVADLIQTIKKSRVPIICICNDKYSPKLKSLRNAVLELDFRKPTTQQISRRMMEICQKEGLSMNQATMDALVQTANGDLRLVLGQLQMIRLRAKALSYDQVRSGGFGTAKDFEMSPFEAARKLLSPDCDSLSLGDQLDLVFQDMDLVPLLVQENYVNHRPRLASSEVARLKILAKAADSISAGDVATRRVRQYQNWSLMPFAAAMGSVTPAAWVRGNREVLGIHPGENNFPRFTAWLGNNSSSGKQRRLLGELHTRMLSSTHIETDRTGLRLSYLPVLRNVLVKPLIQDGKEGIPVVLGMMRDYCIAREDIDFITDVTKWRGQGAWKEDPFKPIETQVKSAFTRAFNQLHLKPRTGAGMEDGVTKRRGKGKGRGKAAAPADDEDDEEEAGLGELAEGGGGSAAKTLEEEEEEEQDPVMIRQKAMALKSKGLTLTLKDGTTAATGRGARSGGRGRGRGGSTSGRGSGRGRGTKGGAASGRGSGSGRGRGAKK
ncbi:hypothetical protein N2152v2_004612 [Parachlorella kessleri]